MASSSFHLTRDIHGDTLNITESVNPTITIVANLVANTLNPNDITINSSPFTLTLTKIGNIVVMDWSEIDGVVNTPNVVYWLQTKVPIPPEFIPRSGFTGSGWYIVPEFRLNVAVGGNPIPAVGYAPVQYLGTDSGSGIMYIGVDNPINQFWAQNTNFFLDAGSAAYHI